MSNNRRICVCGKQRGKEPVIITITTCRRKHSPKDEESICISSLPLATSSPINVNADTKSPHAERKSNKSENDSKPDDTAYVTANETAYETARDDLTTTSSNFETALESMEDDTGKASPFETANDIDTTEQGNETSILTENQENETLNDTEITEAEASVQSDTNEPTVMMVTEIAVNTIPFLDNLFKSNVATKSMPSLLDNQAKNNNCTMELLIFEKHAQNCKTSSKSFKNSNYFFDGDSVFETIGRMSFPTCNNSGSANPSKSEPVVTCLKDNEVTSYGRNSNQYTKALETFERYIRNHQFNETLNRGNILPFDFKFQKYIFMDKHNENKESPRYNIEELYSKKLTSDRSVQFGGVFISNVRTSKWYDVFLMCFGLKNNDDAYDIKSKHTNLIPKIESSYLLTKYLRI